MKTKIFILLLGLLSAGGIYAGNIKLRLAAYIGQEATIKYYSGYRTDSIKNKLDETGQGQLIIPDYTGLVELSIGTQIIQFIVDSGTTQITSELLDLTPETVSFTGSPETMFLYNTLTQKSKNMWQLNWIHQGLGFYPPSSSLYAMLLTEESNINNESKRSDAALKQSPLYAAHFMSLIEYDNRLNNISQESEIKSLIKEMENDLDIISLYRSGQLWTKLLLDYAKLFF